MQAFRAANARGHANHGWLDTYHTFSFSTYHDPSFMGFRALRVINEDRVEAGQGFSEHPHRDMEILTYVISGQLAHRDSMGNGSVILPGNVQGMSAGTGIRHSEFNASDAEPVHLLQMWIEPHTKGVTPAYGKWHADGSEKKGWSLTASGFGEKGAIVIHQHARLWLAKLSEAAILDLPVEQGRYGWLQVAEGTVQAGDHTLHAGDGLAFSGGDIARIVALSRATALLFDLA